MCVLFQANPTTYALFSSKFAWQTPASEHSSRDIGSNRQIFIAGERLDLGTVCIGCFAGIILGTGHFSKKRWKMMKACESYAFDFAKHTLPHCFHMPHSVVRCHLLSLADCVSAGWRQLQALPTSLAPWASRPWTQADSAGGTLVGHWQGARRQVDIVL